MRCPRLRLRTKVVVILSLCAIFLFVINFLLLGEQENTFDERLGINKLNPNRDGGHNPTSSMVRHPQQLRERDSHANKNKIATSGITKHGDNNQQSDLFSNLEQKLLLKLKNIPEIHLQMKLGVRDLVEELSRDLIRNRTQEPSQAFPWKVAASWVKYNEIFPASAPEMGLILHALSSRTITKASFAEGGSQLKIQLQLEGGQKVLFKPKRYERDEVIYGSPYGGADRHNGEIASFHLARLLDLRWSPLVMGRRINLKDEITPVADKPLLSTFLNRGSSMCFYAKCTYCEPSYAACADGEVMDGAVILWLPYPLKSYPHPWKRTYKTGKFAPWEVNSGFCTIVEEHSLYKTGPRLLDLIDVAVFDFLIGNADRHHYVTFANKNASRVLLMDNGKSFGNPYEDELSILAPLLQCCKLRRSTWERLQLFTGQALSQTLKEVMSHDPLTPVLAEVHLWSLDRRLLKVLAAVELCIESRGKQNVIQKNSV